MRWPITAALVCVAIYGAAGLAIDWIEAQWGDLETFQEWLPLPGPEPVVLGYGKVQVTLRWSEDVDLNLHVVDPHGAEIHPLYDPKAAETDGVMDVIANTGCRKRMEEPVENIHRATLPPKAITGCM